MPLCHKRSAQRTPFETYLRDINETALLDVDSEQDLAHSIEEGDSEARDQMVRANLRLVVNIARKYTRPGVCLEDLIAEGNLGLMRAVEAFDPGMGTRFSTYASYWIKQSIKRAVINTSHEVRLPAYANELMVKWRRETGRLQEELGRTPTEEEIAASLKLSKKKFAIVRKALRIYNAGVQTDHSDADRSFEELVEDNRAQAPDTLLMGADDLRQVLAGIDRLEWREAAVLRLRFGLTGDEPKTLKAIGETLGLTRERVRQIETEALAKLRDGLE